MMSALPSKSIMCCGRMPSGPPEEPAGKLRTTDRTPFSVNCGQRSFEVTTFLIIRLAVSDQ